MEFSHPEGRVDLNPAHLIIAGWTGRNRDAVDHHIAELAELGISPPSQVPLFYRASASLLTHGEWIDVLGTGTSGEVEPFLIRQDGQTWIGLASDHTDRNLEAHSVAASKQICAKPVGKSLWSFDSVSDHLDDISLSCQVQEDGIWTDYQTGTLSNILPLADLISEANLHDGTAMLCGTLPAIGGVRPVHAYRMRMHDPVMDAAIDLHYSVTELPIVN